MWNFEVLPPNTLFSLHIVNHHPHLHVAGVVVDLEILLNVQQPCLDFFPSIWFPVETGGFNFFKFTFQVIYFFFPLVLTWFSYLCVSLDELPFLSTLTSLSGSLLLSVHCSFPLFRSCKLYSKISLISCCYLDIFSVVHCQLYNYVSQWSNST